MINDAKLAGKVYVDAFATLYPIDPAVGITMAIFSFVSCYSMMSDADRFRTCVSLFEIVKDIASEKFEDGPDFVDFMKQKLTEKKEHS